MKTYLSTSISGLQQPVRNLLKENINDVNIILTLDGLIVYQTKEKPDKIKNPESDDPKGHGSGRGA